MSKKNLHIIRKEEVDLSQTIFVDSDCEGLIPEILKLTKNVNIKNVKTLTGEDTPTNDEIHEALQEMGVGLLVFVTRNWNYFHQMELRSEAGYHLIWISNEENYNDTLAKDLILALEHDSDLKKIKTQGSDRIIFMAQRYLKFIKEEVRKAQRRKTKKR
jgi:hypothetical protein